MDNFLTADNTNDSFDGYAGKIKDHARNEIDAGLGDLAHQSKQQSELLKSGGRSGITGEFGKLVLFDNTESGQTDWLDGQDDSKPADNWLNKMEVNQPKGKELDSAKQDKAAGGDQALKKQQPKDKTDANVDKSDRLKMKTDAQGNEIYENSKERTTVRKDGSIRFEHKDGRGGIFERNAKGQITEFQTKDGKSYKIAYDKDGKINKVVDAKDGSTYKKEGNNWTVTDRDGEKHKLNKDPEFKIDRKGISGRFDGFDIRTVARDGVSTYKGKDYTAIERTDGTRNIQHKDGSRVLENKYGRVLELKTRKGENYKFDYDKSGNPVKVVDAKAKTTYTKEGKDWFVTDKDGHKEKLGYDPQFKIDENGFSMKLRYDRTRTVGRDGNTVYQNRDSKEIVRRDDSILTRHKDGSSMVTDKDCNTTQFKTANGQEMNFKYDSKGKITEIRIPGSGIFQKDGASWYKMLADGSRTKMHNIRPDISKDGFAFTDSAGKRVLIKRDGSRVTKK